MPFYGTPLYGTLVLGNNEILDCELALVIEQEEVFRLRARQPDGSLIVDLNL